jgi:hypothetical protein
MVEPPAVQALAPGACRNFQQIRANYQAMRHQG